MHQYPEYTREGDQDISLGPGMSIVWQEGPIEQGENGAQPELPVRAVIKRLEGLNEKMPCEQNREAIRKLYEVLWLFDDRTRDRYQRGVMGKEEI